ncbi:uncharacterized protein BDR25DRAFT_350787 [Lindgomyces ingoldianus]|uniref:Uncharacterized protein n=1 Tax=Lindgomyces ingoldianus TaxID=673940 RepID=A0ACB6R8A4_9PLEO|nr:uncharacterized protein BDR25DRAFT_350787 [Lindgomyces ingoldianus]KAF2475411.1 hypothetical protein BDR25DRAFT_350787 [Lindgomyces ingoldianus]
MGGFRFASCNFVSLCSRHRNLEEAKKIRRVQKILLEDVLNDLELILLQKAMVILKWPERCSYSNSILSVVFPAGLVNLDIHKLRLSFNGMISLLVFSKCRLSLIHISTASPNVRTRVDQLSGYSWGRDQPYYSTKKIPVKDAKVLYQELPKIIQDAIGITTELGHHYLCIGSLSIPGRMRRPLMYSRVMVTSTASTPRSVVDVILKSHSKGGSARIFFLPEIMGGSDRFYDISSTSNLRDSTRQCLRSIMRPKNETAFHAPITLLRWAQIPAFYNAEPFYCCYIYDPLLF